MILERRQIKQFSLDEIEIEGILDLNNQKIRLIFDDVYREWMQNLFVLAKKINEQQEKYMVIMIPNAEDTVFSFLGTSLTVVSQFFYFLFKDELSQSVRNFNLFFLSHHLEENNTLILPNEIRKYAQKLIRDDFNDLLVGEILNFYFAIWSAFEAAINILTRDYENNILEGLEKRTLKKVKKIYKTTLSKILNDDEVNSIDFDKFILEQKEDIIKTFPSYISFPNRIDYLFKEKINNYSREEKKDKEILLFAGALRNTIHNNGKHFKKDMKLVLNEHTFRLNQGETSYWENYQDILILVNEIFDIYVAILESIIK